MKIILYYSIVNAFPNHILTEFSIKSALLVLYCNKRGWFYLVTGKLSKHLSELDKLK